MTRVWKPVEEDRLTLLLLDEHGIGLTVYENGRVLTVSTDAGSADMRLAEQYRLCIATEVDEPVAIPDEQLAQMADEIVQDVLMLNSSRLTLRNRIYRKLCEVRDSLKGGQDE